MKQGQTRQLIRELRPAPCPECKGSGRNGHGPCLWCSGTGQAEFSRVRRRAYQDGHHAGLNDVHFCKYIYQTGEEWSAWLDGWRAGQKELRAIRNCQPASEPPGKRRVRKKQKPQAQWLRRLLYLRRVGRLGKEPF